jgi:hypothetical protein
MHLHTVEVVDGYNLHVHSVGRVNVDTTCTSIHTVGGVNGNQLHIYIVGRVKMWIQPARPHQLLSQHGQNYLPVSSPICLLY